MNYKKALACGKFYLSIKNNIISKNSYWNSQIFTLFNTKHQEISIFHAFTKLIILRGGVEKIIFWGAKKEPSWFTLCLESLFEFQSWKIVEIQVNQCAQFWRFFQNIEFIHFLNYKFSLIFQMSMNHKKTLTCWKFNLSSKNTIILKIFYQIT